MEFLEKYNKYVLRFYLCKRFSIWLLKRSITKLFFIYFEISKFVNNY